MNVYLGGLYKEVEYIETSGTQYIETPFKTQDGYLHKTKVRYLSFNTNWCSFGGGYSNFAEARFFFGTRGDRNQWTWGLGSNFGDLGSVSTGVDYELEAKLYNGSQSFIVNGSTLKTDTFSFSASERYNVCLIGSSYYDATLAWSSTRVYYYKLYDSSNNLVLDMIPCYRLSDNEIGMFDKINNQFYTNSGTGTFTKGSDIKTFQAELKNAYIGEVWTPGSNTLLYLPLEKDATDYSGRSISTTASNVTYAILGGVMCANANGSSSKISINSDVIPNGATEGTISAIIYLKSGTANDSRFIEYNRPNAFFGLNYNSGYAVYCVGQTGVITTKVGEYNQWIHMLVTFDSSGYEMYCNGVLVNTGSSPSNVWGNALGFEQNRYIFSDRDGIHNFWNGGGRELILENKKRTVQEIQNYYNRIKAKLGF